MQLSATQERLAVAECLGRISFGLCPSCLLFMFSIFGSVSSMDQGIKVDLRRFKMI